MDLFFLRFGCGYVLSLICDDFIGDVRCVEDDYICDFVLNMILFNGCLV